jgi:hypothetical protein
VQTEDYAKASELFSTDYAYFSSTSTGWLKHAAEYVKKVVPLFELNSHSLVVEIASNDGYLLKHFVDLNVPCLGIEPTDSTADAAEKLNIPVLREFFGAYLARQLCAKNKRADLIIANNVYAHVPDINDFTLGIQILLNEGGTVTVEFPHLLSLLRHTQFDTVYHEHFSYLSLTTVCRIFKQHGLRVWDVEELSTHGGSLRVYGCHNGDRRGTKTSVTKLLNIEQKHGLLDLVSYRSFQSKAEDIKNALVFFLIEQKKLGKKVVAYGAAAKGNTLLNFAGVRPDLLAFVCDRAIAKQNKYLPGSHIPILNPKILLETNIDYLLILPWNIADEVRQQNRELLVRGTKFVTAIPTLQIHN